MPKDIPGWYDEGISKCCNAVIDGGLCSSCGTPAQEESFDDGYDPLREIERDNALAALAFD